MSDTPKITERDRAVGFLLNSPCGIPAKPMVICEAAKKMAGRYDLTYSEALETIRVTAEYNRHNKFECEPEGPTEAEQMLDVARDAMHTLRDTNRIISQVADDSVSDACTGLANLPSAVSEVADKIEAAGWYTEAVADAIKEITPTRE